MNSILNKYDNFGAIIKDKKNCCGDLFAGDIVLIALSKENMISILHYPFKLTNKNEMSLRINKY